MSIETLFIYGVRNLADSELSLSPKVNVFFGDNGAGKTSVLEAIHLLTMARSFKLSRSRTMIAQGVDEAIVYSDITDLGRVVVRRNQKGQYQIRLNGQALKSLSELVVELPIQVIQADSFALIEGTPGDRRHFLDWGVFHQTASFHTHWQNLQKSLKNRNSLLRSGRMSGSEQVAWERAYLEAAEQIDVQRKAYLEGYVPCFHQVLSRLIDVPDLRIHYYRGWDKDKSLAEVLDNQRERDAKLGYTQYGPQRADMRIKIGKVNAADLLSRGQQKLIVCALKIAQSMFLQAHHSCRVIFLIDDLPSELDHHHINKLVQLLDELKVQVFMTCVDPDPLRQLWKSPDHTAMFHVEHGKIKSG